MALDSSRHSPARHGTARHGLAGHGWARLDGRTPWCSLLLSLRAGALPSASPEGASLPKQVSPMLRGTAAAAARCLKVSGLVCWQYIPLRKDFFPYSSYFLIPQQCGFHISFGAGVILARGWESFWCSLSPSLQLRPEGGIDRARGGDPCPKPCCVPTSIPGLLGTWRRAKSRALPQLPSPGGPVVARPGEAVPHEGLGSALSSVTCRFCLPTGQPCSHYRQHRLAGTRALCKSPGFVSLLFHKAPPPGEAPARWQRSLGPAPCPRSTSQPRAQPELGHAEQSHSCQQLSSAQ